MKINMVRVEVVGDVRRLAGPGLRCFLLSRARCEAVERWAEVAHFKWWGDLDSYLAKRVTDAGRVAKATQEMLDVLGAAESRTARAARLDVKPLRRPTRRRIRDLPLDALRVPPGTAAGEDGSSISVARCLVPGLIVCARKPVISCKEGTAWQLFFNS